MSGRNLVIRSASVEDTRAVGAAFGRSLAPGATISLEGPLGSGKTEFVRGFCEAFGVTSAVTSPTYTLCNEYVAGDGTRVVHVDAFRLQSVEELSVVALDERRDAKGAVLVEWGERVIDALPPNTIRVLIEPVPGEDSARRLLVRVADAEQFAAAFTLAASVEDDR